MEKVLVTGGTGFVGGHLCRQLLQQGYTVRVLARRPDEKLQACGAELVAGDLRDAQSLQRACQGMDTVFHVAALSGDGRDRERYITNNVVGTELLLKASRERGIKAFVYTSSPSVVMSNQPIRQGDESLPFPKRFLNPYSESKALAEQAVLASNSRNMRCCALRPHAIFGLGDRHLLPRLLARHQAGHLRIIGDGHNKISVCYVASCIQAHIQAAQSEAVAGKSYFINEPEPVHLWPWLNQVFLQLGMKPIQRKIPFVLAHTIGQSLDCIYRCRPSLGEPRLSAYLCQLLAKDHYFSVVRAQQDFGFKPATTLEQALQQTLQPMTIALGP